LVVCGSRVFTSLRTQGWVVLQWLFFATTAISLLRIIFLGVMVLWGRRQFAKTKLGFRPPVTVLIPAYNEAKVIRRTLDGILNSDYPDLEIMVVDDGSTDDTAAIVAGYALQHPQVSLVTKPNGGKWSALNAGFTASRREYLVTIDADTIVPPGTIGELIAPFADPQVDAVCGNVQVGNIHNILTAFQDLEYVTTQNYDRRAFHALNCISVVPGATGAWRRQSVLNADGYSPQTLTEDADLTLTMLTQGAKIVYAPDARSVTEAPDSCPALFKQRLRWSFGTFQCLWKHRRQLFNGSLGWVAMPNLLCFQVIYPLLSPIGDVVFVLSLLRGDFGAVAIGYLIFLAMDLVGSLIAFRLDGRSARTLWVVLIQRFFYRQFMYLVAFRSILEAIKGGRQAWNKLDRKGSVSLSAMETEPF
ncbi:MAG: glycosyltransferase, partial [Verrucomicrobiota bacterium]